MTHPPPPLRIAITGGGLAGASLFHALLPHPHLSLQIFESAPSFRESGAAVGLTRNAQTALKLIGPSAVQGFQRAGAVSQKGAHLVLAQTGETVGRIGGEEEVVGVVSRAEFLKELLAGAPAGRMHVSKKLVEVEYPGGEDGPLVLRFKDGTTHECDVLIGADGIRSRVRKVVLGEGDPAAEPVPAGWWVVQVLKPYEEVAALLSREYLDKDHPGEVGWIGGGALIFHNILSNGDLAQFVVVVCEQPDASRDRVKEVSSEEIRGIYKAWPAQLANAVEKLVCTQEKHTALCFWEHRPARTYVRGAVAVMGDAAHATTAWQGSGAGMSVEDSMILSTLSGQARSPKDARVGLQIYDSLRRARTQKVVESSRGTGQMVTGQDHETGLDAAKLQDKLRHRWDFILDFDVEAHREDALRQMTAHL